MPTDKTPDAASGAVNEAPDFSFWLQNQTRNNAINISENTYLDGSSKPYRLGRAKKEFT